MAYVLVTLCCVFVSLGSFLFGYDSGMISYIIEEDTFLEKFGSPSLSDAASGGIIASYTGGAILGALLASYISDSAGRRIAIFAGGLLAVLGAALQGGAMAISMLIAGRFIAGLAIGLTSATIPVYCSEIAPACIRGLLASMQQWMICLGIIVAQWVGYGCSRYSDDFIWRFPLSFQTAPAIILTCGVLFLPESPRWLLQHGKDKAARSALTRLHLNRSATNSQLVDYELAHIREGIAHEDHRAVSWRHLLKSTRWRYRLLLACGLQIFTQCSGANVIQNYMPQLYKSLGLSTSTSLMIIGLLGALAQLWNTVFMLFIDKVGRRKLLIPSLLGMGAALCVEAALAHYVDFSDLRANPNALRGAIAMFFMFSLCFTGLGLISWVYQTEIFPTALRARGSSAATATTWSINLLLTQSSPVAFRNIGPKYLYCFAAFNWAAVFIVWLWYPETLGRTLEGVEDVFAIKPTVPQPEIIAASPSPGNLRPHSQMKHKGMDPLSMHPNNGSWSSRSTTSPRLWCKKTGEV
ncbi:hypothetical protein N7493_004786 [Penicillium malachiteum]|uniref:Major facilitator superfamily (MFS) profile domain-containing protein n=1 Tax=Penicillium malachiteum TaxID=1324776 RepID=A0AAD6MXD3_9EURO|nr:hypothetical protein N7493_004786 [Penicillium malachiteum]